MTKNKIAEKLQTVLDEARKKFDEALFTDVFGGAKAFGCLEAHIENIIKELEGE